MGKKAPITCQSTRVDLVIRKNKSIPLDLIKSYCESECLRYAFIEHKGDIAVDTGEVEGTHYHLVLEYREGKIAFSTRLNTICKWFHFENTNGLEIDRIGSLSKCLQYLIHKNNSEKTQHDIKEVIYNYEPNEFKILMETKEEQSITYELLFKGCCECSYKYELVKFFSPNVYRTWRMVILDMWEDLHSESKKR